ncbi:thiamine biosynthesis protein ThiS [Halorhodospira neutriphila]|uniref:Thiamine biosynthesis protein ThiS n=1 Tax=Halorhodospira neutriphila TaxID=168379 RepID=A0ABS1E167_9GAMM|nr:thiamine biosynthesis protein ThiS [Halorhodospira neutriphila]
MHVRINGEAAQLPAGASCADVLARLGITEQRRLAVERNEQIVPRSRLAEQELADGDRIEVIQAIGGG